LGAFGITDDNGSQAANPFSKYSKEHPMDYVPHTPEDQQKMMQTIGIAVLDDLFVDIPEKFRLRRLLDLPPVRRM
jgi:glycine cleavage system pyridoxal-binding protein P